MMNYLSLHAAANQAAADKVLSYFCGHFTGEQQFVSHYTPNLPVIEL